MTVAQSKLAQILFYAVLLGLFLGLFCDFFRIRRRHFSLIGFRLGNQRCKELLNCTVIFFEDVLYFFVCAVVMCIFIYHTNSGRMRGVAFLGALGGFCIYRKTVGRLVMHFSGYVISVVRRLINKAYKYAVRPLLGLLWLLYSKTVGRALVNVLTLIIEYRLSLYAKKGFGILKKRNENKGRIKDEEANKHIRKGGNLRFHRVLHGDDYKDAI